MKQRLAHLGCILMQQQMEQQMEQQLPQMLMAELTWRQQQQQQLTALRARTHLRSWTGQLAHPLSSSSSNPKLF